jgi:predicted N-acyltransferase
MKALVMVVAVVALIASLVLIGGAFWYLLYWLLVAPVFGLTYELTYWQAVVFSVVLGIITARVRSGGSK